MAFQSFLLLVILISSVLLIVLLVVCLFRLLVNVILCLPRFFFPSIFPQSISFSSPFFLFMCPKNFICLSLIVLISVLLQPAIVSISLFVFLSFQDIFKILLRNHISAASSLLSVPLFNVQLSHPYSRIDHTYALRVLNLVQVHIFLFLNTGEIKIYSLKKEKKGVIDVFMCMLHR